MKGRDQETALAVLLGVPADTLRGWLSGEAMPPEHVFIAGSLIEAVRSAEAAAPRAERRQVKRVAAPG